MKTMQRLTIKAIAPAALLLGVWAGPAGAGFEGATNTFYGTEAGMGSAGNDTHRDTFVGAYAGKSNTSGFGSTFLGFAAGYNNTTGNWNTFLGNQAGFYNTTGNYNAFLGNQAGAFNTTGNNNTFLGSAAGYRNTIGSSNAFLGNQAGISNTTGASNTSVGYEAGHDNTTGNGNVFLGHQAGYNETGSNKLYIANSITSTPLLHGQFGVGRIVAKLTVNGNLGVGVDIPTFPLQMASGAHVTTGGVWTNASSRAYKEQIVALNGDEAMAAVKALTPVTFRYLTEQVQHVGFIAEDVPALVATPDRKSVSSMDVVAVLTRAVQEQQKLIEEQQKSHDARQHTVEALRKVVEEQQQVLAALAAEVKELRADGESGGRVKAAFLSR